MRLIMWDRDEYRDVCQKGDGDGMDGMGGKKS